MIDLGDLTRALASGLIFTLIIALILAGCAVLRDAYNDLATARGYDTTGIFKRQDIPSQFQDAKP